jgi:hypothetical protein
MHFIYHFDNGLHKSCSHPMHGQYFWNKKKKRCSSSQMSWKARFSLPAFPRWHLAIALWGMRNVELSCLLLASCTRENYCLLIALLLVRICRWHKHHRASFASLLWLSLALISGSLSLPQGEQRWWALQTEFFKTNQLAFLAESSDIWSSLQTDQFGDWAVGKICKITEHRFLGLPAPLSRTC